MSEAVRDRSRSAARFRTRRNAFYIWRAKLERGVRVDELTDEEIDNLITALEPNP